MSKHSDARRLRFGQRLLNFRGASEMTQRELAKVARLTHGEISHIENGKLSPSLETVSRLAKALGLTVLTLVDKTYE